MSQTDAEHGDTFTRDFSDGRWRIIDGSGIAGSIRQKHAIRLELENLFGGRLRGNDGYTTIVLGEEPQDISLDPVVVGRDVIRRAGISPCVRLRGRDSRREVEPFHRWTSVERGQCVATRLRSRGDHGAHNSSYSQVLCQASRVNLLQNGGFRVA